VDTASNSQTAAMLDVRGYLVISNQMDPFETVSERLENFIEVRCVDSMATHLRQIFLSEHEGKICGSINHNKISIWTSGNQIIGAFYPVVQLKFNVAQKKIVAKAKMNQFGFGLALLINISIPWVSLNLFILREGLNANSILQRILGFVVFIGIFNFPIYMSYKIARNVIMREIEDRLKTNSR
jgi:hypothetical protein